MKNLLVIVTILVLTLACSKEPENRDFFIQKGKTIVKCQFKNLTEPKSFQFWYNQTLPVNQYSIRFNIENDTAIIYELDLNHPANVNFISENNESVIFFIIPNDTLTVSFDFKKSNNLKESIEYLGTTSSICDYLTMTRNRFNGAPSKNESTESFCNLLDSYYTMELKKLDSTFSHNNLPKWYYDIEKENINYERDFLKLLQFQKHIWFNREFIHRDSSLKNSLEINKNNYPWLENYNRLLSSFCSDKYDTLLLPKNVNNEIFMQYNQDNIDELKGRISEESYSYFVASKISVLYSGKRLLKFSPQELSSSKKLIDKFIENNSHLIKDSSLFAYLIEEKNKEYKKYLNLNRLSSGDKAPNFYLEGIDGTTVKLTYFKNKVVLLNFWGTFCSPCIKNISMDNKIVNQFKHKDFVLINICTDYKVDEWKRIIKENDFKGIHLICKGNWNEILHSKYNIFSVPHYSLIDRNGLIIKNDIRDSIDFYIKESI